MFNQKTTFTIEQVQTKVLETKNEKEKSIKGHSASAFLCDLCGFALKTVECPLPLYLP